jgi:predicted N-acyltransferase
MLRSGVQFHWTNPGFASFDDYLAALAQPKRKKIRAERRKVAEQGFTHRVLEGTDASEADWNFFYRCYVRTYRAHMSTPYLTREFFATIARTMPQNLLLVISSRDGRQVASSFLMRSSTRLYGRYWGALEPAPFLHFECAYYQPIEWAIANRIATFEGGAQGEHKLARGFLPVKTWSAHWLAHPDFADAVERYLARESGGIDEYLDELTERNPFRPADRGDET